MNEKKEELHLEILTEKDTYENGEWISYAVIIANNSKQSVYYKISSCNIEIIGNNGYHTKTNIQNTLNIYELKPDSKVKRDMTCYNGGEHDFAHLMGIKNFTGSFRRKDAIDSVAGPGLNWNTWLSLPEGEYTFFAEFFYYEDKDCLNTPKKLTATKKINIISDGSSKIEEEIILEDRLRFYAVSDKNIYRTGEPIRTWGKIEPIEGKWYPWYEQQLEGQPAEQAHVYITLINCDTKEELDIYNRMDLIPNEYKDPYFILPNSSTSSSVPLHRWLKKEGNYIIHYWLEYLTYETQEPKVVTIDLPITVIPNESGKTFYYSSSSYPVPAFEEYDDTCP